MFLSLHFELSSIDSLHWTHTYAYPLTHLFPKNNVLIQNAVETKPKSRIPPKQEVKTESFQGIQLKPVTKDGKQPQQAESTKVELKVAPLKKDRRDLAANLYVVISLCLSLKASLHVSRSVYCRNIKQRQSIIARISLLTLFRMFSRSTLIIREKNSVFNYYLSLLSVNNNLLYIFSAYMYIYAKLYDTLHSSSVMF